jgi:FAD:protein FMN transferase
MRRLCVVRRLCVTGRLRVTRWLRQALLVSTVLLPRPASAQIWQRVEAERSAMGTRFRLTVCAVDTAGLARAVRSSWESVDRIEAVLSDYDPGSEVSRLSRARSGSLIRVSPTLWAAWTESERWRRATQGAFDASLGALTRLWRRSIRRQQVPDSALVAEARQRSGRAAMMVGNGTLGVAVPGARLDFGGIGKGIAADSVVATMRGAGFPRMLIDAGGDVTAGDAPPGESGWRVRVSDGAIWSVHNASVASSGDPEQHLQAEGRRYSHILDPETGVGLLDSDPVVVVAETGAAADALATALSIRPALAAEVIRGGRAAVIGRGTASRTLGSPPLALPGKATSCRPDFP